MHKFISSHICIDLDPDSYLYPVRASMLCMHDLKINIKCNSILHTSIISQVSDYVGSNLHNSNTHIFYTTCERQISNYSKLGGGSGEYPLQIHAGILFYYCSLIR